MASASFTRKRMTLDRTGLGTGLPKGGKGIPDVGVGLCDPAGTRGQVLGCFRHELLPCSWQRVPLPAEVRHCFVDLYVSGPSTPRPVSLLRHPMNPLQSSTAAAVLPLTAFACRDRRESLVFGERADGTIAHISEVASGLECNCVCPGCGTRLIARKGNKQDHHFGHYGTEDGRPCQTGPETALHKFAKEVLAHRLELELPPLAMGEGHGKWVRYPGGRYGFDAALLENRLGEIVPM